MTRCPSCSSEIAESTRFCSQCGEAVSSVSQLPTGLATPSVARAAARRPPSSQVGRLASSDAIDSGGFTPGTVLAERYRIIGLIGRGGMGEVYRADDLKLGQPVALKFLPDRLSRDQALLDRFFAEVRTARQVAHPNVCRVYDIGETEGKHFLSMEYVDGEDLASLLRRIGRLPADKALELSRQLCAGLSAAHDRGILHRDLKPANVMVDGRGRVRIMDFGLAVAVDEAAETPSGGTLAYMAPELFEGKGASVRSDLYALGLVLYELYTGRRVFDGVTLADFRRKHLEEPPTSPSAIVKEMEPAVERAILRCIEKDPAQRPSSAAQVAAALPGGDPLAAALAAGETPSPEMVAAAGADQQIGARVARPLFASVVVLLAALFALIGKTHLLAAVNSDKSPEVLRARAREILAGLGMTQRPADWAFDVFANDEFLDWVEANDHSVDRWQRGIARDAVNFFYRETPSLLLPTGFIGSPFPGPRVSDYDPAPSIQSGASLVELDVEGRLKTLEVQAPEHEKPSESAAGSVDWTPLFRAAGLDIVRFKPVEPLWAPQTFVDARAAWEGPHPERPGLTMRVEAGAYRGRLTFFRWVGPWSQPNRDLLDSLAPILRLAEDILQLTLLALFFGGGWLARQNLRAGRGDRRGAARLATFVIACQLGAWALGAHHLVSSFEVRIFTNGVAHAFLLGAFVWLVYVALEPFARRHWPQMLVSWTRLFAGGLRDPLVGRDLLIGASAASLLAIVSGPLARLGSPPTVPRSPFYAASLRDVLGWSLGMSVWCLIWTLGVVFFLVFVRRIVRVKWLAEAIVILIFSANSLGASPTLFAVNVLGIGVLTLVAARFGLLAALTLYTLETLLRNLVSTSDPSAWYFYTGPIAIAVVLAIAYWALRSAVGRRVEAPAV